MRKLLVCSLSLPLGTLALLASPACAQLVGGDQFSLRRALGPEAYTVETFDRPTAADTRRAPTVNPGAAGLAPASYQMAPAAQGAQQRYSNTTQSALNYYGAAGSQQPLNPLPQRQRFISQHQAAPAGGAGQSVKPFNHAVPEPTISPYHNLYRDERSETLPNYFTLVRPHQQQMEQNRQQQRQLQRLERQVRRGFTPTPAPGTVPATAHTPRFGDTGQYYNGWR